MLTSLLISAMLAAGQDAAPPAPQQTPAPAVAAQSAPQPEAQLEDIIVEGLRLQEASKAFVESVGAAPRGTSLATWTRTVCVGVTGLPTNHAQYLIDRVSALALELGLEVGEPGCKPNVIVLAAEDGRATAEALVQRSSMGFRPTAGGSSLGRDALRDFRSEEAPLRWWHVALPFSVDTGELATSLRSEDPISVASRGGSRLAAPIRHDLAWVVVVIDLKKAQGKRFPALVDEIAFVSMAQVNPDPEEVEGKNTILNLFHPDASVEALTEWDMDYLKALYAARPDRPNPGMQEREIARGLASQRRTAQDAPVQ